MGRDGKGGDDGRQCKGRGKRGEGVWEGRERTWDGTGGKVNGKEEEGGKGGAIQPQSSISGTATVYRCFPN